MKKILLILVLFAGFLVWQSCEYEWVYPELNIPDSVSFSRDIQPIFDARCVECHKTNGTSPDLSQGIAYNSIKAGNLVDTDTPENSILYKEVAPGGGMSSYTTLGDPEYILKWIQQGALDN